MGVLKGPPRSLLKAAEEAEMSLEKEPSQLSYDLLNEAPSQPVKLEALRKLRPDQEAAKRRAAPRYQLAIHVIISNGFKTFRTESENVSQTGLLLKDLVPEEFMEGHIEIVLKDDTRKHATRYLHFKGQMVHDGPLRSRRLAFKTANVESESHFNSLLRDLAAVC